MEYTLIRSAKRRTIAIQIKPGQSSKSVIVRAPAGVAKSYIDKIVANKAPWIKRKLADQLPDMPQMQQPLAQGQLLLFGTKLPLKIEAAAHSSVEHNGAQVALYYSSRSRNPEKTMQTLLLKWYKEQLLDYLDSTLTGYQSKMGLYAANYNVRQYKRRWGSCDNRGQLRFNLWLAAAPHWVIDSVVVHELAHLKYLHHGSQFWALVAKYDPNHKAATTWLKQHGASLSMFWEK